MHQLISKFTFYDNNKPVLEKLFSQQLNNCYAPFRAYIQNIKILRLKKTV